MRSRIQRRAHSGRDRVVVSRSSSSSASEASHEPSPATKVASGVHDQTETHHGTPRSNLGKPVPRRTIAKPSYAATRSRESAAPRSSPRKAKPSASPSPKKPRGTRPESVVAPLIQEMTEDSNEMSVDGETISMEKEGALTVQLRLPMVMEEDDTERTALMENLDQIELNLEEEEEEEQQPSHRPRDHEDEESAGTDNEEESSEERLSLSEREDEGVRLEDSEDLDEEEADAFLALDRDNSETREEREEIQEMEAMEVNRQPSEEEVRDDIDEKYNEKRELEGQDTLEQSYFTAYQEFANGISQMPEFEGIVMETRSFASRSVLHAKTVRMNRRDYEGFWDTLMFAVHHQFYAELVDLTKKHTISLENGRRVKDQLVSMIQEGKEEAYAYQKENFEVIFMKEMIGYAFAKPFMPLDRRRLFDKDGKEYPIAIHPLGNLIMNVVSRGCLCFDVTAEPFVLKRSYWNHLSVKEWVDEHWDRDAGMRDVVPQGEEKTRENVIRYYQKVFTSQEFFKRVNKTTNGRETLRSMLYCAFSGLPIFPGDLVHAVKIVFRSDHRGCGMGNPSVREEDRTNCLFVLAELDNFVPRVCNDSDEDKEEDSEVYQEELDLRHEQGVDSSGEIITAILNAATILGDSHLPLDRLDTCAPLWFEKQARRLIKNSFENSPFDIPMYDVLTSVDHLKTYYKEVLFYKNNLEAVSHMYAKFKMVLYVLLAMTRQK